jgi:tyrosinase
MGLLTSPRFVGDERLERAANNRPPLMKPEISEGVKKLQQALFDLDYDMPISFANGSPDGIYGKETTDVVRQFQTDEGFPPKGLDGRAGHDTLIALDKHFQPTPPPPAPTPPPPSPGPQQAVTLRKSVWKMSTQEQSRYVKIINDMIADGTYARFVNFHRNMSFNMHAMGGTMPQGRMKFLSWHRIYVRKLEIEMQKRDPAAFVPFWDWRNPDPKGYPDWLNAFVGTTINLPASGSIPATTVTVTRDPAVVSGGKKPDLLLLAAPVGTILGQKTFYNFTKGLEDGPHNNIHMWFGASSTMADLISPSDPIFWTHHGEVDRIWTLWQASNPGVNPDFSRRTLVPPEDYFNLPGDEVMAPFPPPNREDQFRDMSTDYTYDAP